MLSQASRAAVSLVSIALATIAASAADLTARVDPRVELLSVIFRLAGNPEYNQPASNSPYSNDVAAHFGPHRDHPVVGMAQELRARRGISFDAVISLALHVEPPPTLKLRVPLTPWPETLDSRWTPADVNRFLDAARDFARVSDFAGFVAKHQRLYDEAAKRLTHQLASKDFVAWFDKFFGGRPTADFGVIPGLLTGGNCYGCSARLPDGAEEIRPVIGCWNWDASGTPTFDDGINPTVIHEFCHTYTNPLVDKFEAQLKGPGEKIFPYVAERMRRQNYGTWQTMMRESLVRACVARCLLTTEPPAVGRNQIKEEESRGFAWTGELVRKLDEYEQHRDQYPTFEAFMPQIVAFFEGYAPKYAAEMEKAPRVRRMIPRNGDQDVDPNLSEIRITFSTKMRDGQWSVCGGGPNFPEVTGRPHYANGGRTLVLPVKLKPGWQYRFSLNCQNAMNFTSEDGTPLEPVAVEFSTRK